MLLILTGQGDSQELDFGPLDNSPAVKRRIMKSTPSQCTTAESQLQDDSTPQTHAKSETQTTTSDSSPVGTEDTNGQPQGESQNSEELNLRLSPSSQENGASLSTGSHGNMSSSRQDNAATLPTGSHSNINIKDIPGNQGQAKSDDQTKKPKQDVDKKDDFTFNFNVSDLDSSQEVRTSQEVGEHDHKEGEDSGSSYSETGDIDSDFDLFGEDDEVTSCLRDFKPYKEGSYGSHMAYMSDDDNEQEDEVEDREKKKEVTVNGKETETKSKTLQNCEEDADKLTYDKQDNSEQNNENSDSKESETKEKIDAEKTETKEKIDAEKTENISLKEPMESSDSEPKEKAAKKSELDSIDVDLSDIVEIHDDGEDSKPSGNSGKGSDICGARGDGSPTTKRRRTMSADDDDVVMTGVEEGVHSYVRTMCAHGNSMVAMGNQSIMTSQMMYAQQHTQIQRGRPVVNSSFCGVHTTHTLSCPQHNPTMMSYPTSHHHHHHSTMMSYPTMHQQGRLPRAALTASASATRTFHQAGCIANPIIACTSADSASPASTMVIDLTEAEDDEDGKGYHGDTEEDYDSDETVDESMKTSKKHDKMSGNTIEANKGVKRKADMQLTQNKRHKKEGAEKKEGEEKKDEGEDGDSDVILCDDDDEEDDFSELDEDELDEEEMHLLEDEDEDEEIIKNGVEWYSDLDEDDSFDEDKYLREEYGDDSNDCIILDDSTESGHMQKSVIEIDMSVREGETSLTESDKLVASLKKKVTETLAHDKENKQIKNNRKSSSPHETVASESDDVASISIDKDTETEEVIQRKESGQGDTVEEKKDSVHQSELDYQKTEDTTREVEKKVGVSNKQLGTNDKDKLQENQKDDQGMSHVVDKGSLEPDADGKNDNVSSNGNEQPLDNTPVKTAKSSSSSDIEIEAKSSLSSDIEFEGKNSLSSDIEIEGKNSLSSDFEIDGTPGNKTPGSDEMVQVQKDIANGDLKVSGARKTLDLPQR